MQKLNAKKQLTVTILFVLIILSCCTTKQSKQKVSDVPISETVPPSGTEAVPIDNNKKIILSTEDLEKLPAVYAEDNTLLKRINDRGQETHKMFYTSLIAQVNDNDLIIIYDANYDYDVYKIGMIKSNIIYEKNTLSVSPYWKSPVEEEQIWWKCNFVIYEDYTIRIDNKESEKGVIQKSTKYYRISDEGEFYEVKIENSPE